MAVLWWGHFMWFWGLTTPNEWPYLFWSGAGSDLTRLALLAGVVKSIEQRARHYHELKEMHERHHEELMGRGEDA